MGSVSSIPLIDALVSKGIENITIVRGYKKEQFDVLLEKYPFLEFVDNPEFNVTNNISSLMRVIDRIDRCYICEADLVVSNPDILSKYEYATCYLGAKVAETDDWCFDRVNGYATHYQMGGEDCYQAFGISYWSERDSVKLRNDLTKVYNSRAGKEHFWDAVPLRIYKKNYKIEIKICHKSDIVEIDNFFELVALDSSYATYPEREQDIRRHYFLRSRFGRLGINLDCFATISSTASLLKDGIQFRGPKRSPSEAARGDVPALNPKGRLLLEPFLDASKLCLDAGTSSRNTHAFFLLQSNHFGTLTRSMPPDYSLFVFRLLLDDNSPLP